MLLGTSESSGITIANNANGTSSILDLYTLGGAGNATATVAEGHLYLVATSTVTTGTIDVSLQPSNASAGAVYSDDVTLIASLTPKNGTLHAPLTSPFSRVQVPRFVTANILNNATGQNLTNVYLAIELFLYS